MKILQVANSFKYAWSSGGVARVAYDMSVALTKRGHKVTVFSTDKGLIHSSNFEKNHPIDIDGIETYYFSNFSNILAKTGIAIPYYSPLVIGRKKKEFDIIHIHEPRRIMNVLIYYYAKKYQIPYVFQAHGALPPSKSFVKRVMSRIFDYLFTYRLLRDASKVIALTQTEAQQYLSMGVPKSKIEIIPNGIDLSENANLPPKGSFKKKFNIQENTKIILYLGRIHRTKGIDLLIKAYALMVKTMKCNNALLVIAGPDDGYLGELKSLINSLNLHDLVSITGFVSEKEKLSAFVDARVFVTPSFNGFPITFLESLTAGTPIVTTNLGDALDWVNNNVGYVTSSAASELAEALYRIISDDELHAEFSKNCRELVRSKFSIATVVDKLEQTYFDVAKNKSLMQ